MTGPDTNPTPMAKALAAARDSAQQCLQAAADVLASKMPPDGVMCSSLRRRSGHKPVTVLVLWPCWVVELEPGTGTIIAETHIAELEAKRPDTAAFLQRTAESGPARSMLLYPPQSRRQRASIDALCVVRVHDTKTGELRAVSDPGKPCVLRADFDPLTPADLAPRLS